MRLTDKVCEYLIFVTSLYAFMLMRSLSIFVYPLLQLASFSFLSLRFFVLLFIILSHYYYYYCFVISSFVVGYFSYQTKYTCNLL